MIIIVTVWFFPIYARVPVLYIKIKGFTPRNSVQVKRMAVASGGLAIWGFPSGIPVNGWFILENPIKSVYLKRIIRVPMGTVPPF